MYGLFSRLLRPHDFYGVSGYHPYKLMFCRHSPPPSINWGIDVIFIDFFYHTTAPLERLCFSCFSCPRRTGLTVSNYDTSDQIPCPWPKSLMNRFLSTGSCGSRNWEFGFREAKGLSRPTTTVAGCPSLPCVHSAITRLVTCLLTKRSWVRVIDWSE